MGPRVSRWFQREWAELLFLPGFKIWANISQPHTHATKLSRWGIFSTKEPAHKGQYEDWKTNKMVHNMLAIVSHQRNANHNYRETPPHAPWHGGILTRRRTSWQGHGELGPWASRVGRETGVTATENSLTIPQKVKPRSSNRKRGTHAKALKTENRDANEHLRPTFPAALFTRAENVETTHHRWIHKMRPTHNGIRLSHKKGWSSDTTAFRKDTALLHLFSTSH